jgi:hypothetical protein
MIKKERAKIQDKTKRVIMVKIIKKEMIFFFCSSSKVS